MGPTSKMTAARETWHTGASFHPTNISFHFAAHVMSSFGGDCGRFGGRRNGWKLGNSWIDAVWLLPSFSPFPLRHPVYLHIKVRPASHWILWRSFCLQPLILPFRFRHDLCPKSPVHVADVAWLLALLDFRVPPLAELLWNPSCARIGILG